jgi:hypothetical protein
VNRPGDDFLAGAGLARNSTVYGLCRTLLISGRSGAWHGFADQAGRAAGQDCGHRRGRALLAQAQLRPDERAERAELIGKALQVNATTGAQQHAFDRFAAD